MAIYKPNNKIIYLKIHHQFYKHWKGAERDYYEVPTETRNLFAVLYFGLLAALGSGVWYTLQMLGTYRGF